MHQFYVRKYSNIHLDMSFNSIQSILIERNGETAKGIPKTSGQNKQGTNCKIRTLKRKFRRINMII